MNCKACFDYEGNTVLHWATRGDNLKLVEYLIKEVGCDATVKNATSVTAYDFSEHARIRQYLLPIQLQAETKECLANGGQGLAAGIDLGGAQRQMYANLAPPPAAAVMASPPPTGHPPPTVAAAAMGGSAGGYGANSMTSRYVAYTPGSTNIYGGAMVPQPAPAPVVVQQPSQYSYHPQQQQQQQQSMDPPAPSESSIPAPVPSPTVNGNNDPVAAGPMPGPGPSQEAPVSANKKTQQPLFTALPPPPFYNKPAVTKTAPRERLRPDGFHSSSSDVALQKKYGHVKQELGDLPPPPISNGSANGFSFSAYAAPPPVVNVAAPPIPVDPVVAPSMANASIIGNQVPPQQNFAPPPNMNYAASNPAPPQEEEEGDFM